MKFGRKLSFIGHQVCLTLELRNRLCKERYLIENIGTVKIYDNDPKKHPSPNLLATLTPNIVGVGKLQAIWEVPEDLCEGIYYDSWEGLKIEGINKTFNKVQQFFVSEDIFSMEEFLKEDFDIELCPICVFVDSIEYITFKMVKPETLIFPDAEVRLATTTVSNVRFVLETRKIGPGITPDTLFDSNALFPTEPVIVADVPTVAKSEFIPIRSFCDTAYFLFDTRGVKPGVYWLQLKLKLGETEQVLRPLGLTVNELDLSDRLALINPAFFEE